MLLAEDVAHDRIAPELTDLVENRAACLALLATAALAEIVSPVAAHCGVGEALEETLGAMVNLGG